MPKITCRKCQTDFEWPEKATPEEEEARSHLVSCSNCKAINVVWLKERKDIPEHGIDIYKMYFAEWRTAVHDQNMGMSYFNFSSLSKR